MKMSRLVLVLAAVVLLSAGVRAAEVEVHADDCGVGPGETPIAALVKVHDRIDALWAKDTGTVVRLFPFSLKDPTTAARNKIANRDMHFFCYKEPRIVWYRPDAHFPGTDNGSKIWAKRGRNTPWWYDRMKSIHEKIRASDGTFDLVYLGDSITHDMERDPGIDVQRDLERTYSVLNLGYGGDGCLPALWRAKNGELDGYKAKVVTVLIGTNDRGVPPEKIADWIGELLDVIKAKQPQAKIVLMPMLPRSDPSMKALREKNDVASGLYRRYVDDKTVFWCDIRGKVTWPDGRGNYSLLSDGTHPSTSGHRVWRDAMLPYFERFTGKKHVPNDPKVEPFARRWIVVKSDLGASGDEAKALAIADRAKKLGFNGVCLDADFDACATWGAPKRKALASLGRRLKARGMTLTPIIRCADEKPFAETAATLEKLASPTRWMVFTNATASTSVLRKQLCFAAKTITALHKGAEVLVWAFPFAGGTGNVEKDAVTFVCGSWNSGYNEVCKSYHEKGWRTMVAPVLNHTVYLMHYSFYTMKNYVGQPGTDGVIYWTDIGDYEWLDDFADLMKRKE